MKKIEATISIKSIKKKDAEWSKTGEKSRTTHSIFLKSILFGIYCNAVKHLNILCKPTFLYL